MQQISSLQRIRDAVKADGRPLWMIASSAGMHPSRLSRIINGRALLRVQDDGVIRLLSSLHLTADETFGQNDHLWPAIPALLSLRNSLVESLRLQLWNPEEMAVLRAARQLADRRYLDLETRKV